MQLSATFLALIPLTTAYRITSLTSSHLPTHNSTNSVVFTLLDNDPAANNTSALCSSTWPSNSTAPSLWTPCRSESDINGVPAFEWRFGADERAVPGWIGVGDFGLSVRHAYEDPTVGAFPYDQVTTEGWRTVNETVLDCGKGMREVRRSEYKAPRDESCTLKKAIDLEVPVLEES